VGQRLAVGRLPYPQSTMPNQDPDHPDADAEGFYALNPTHQYTRTWTNPQPAWRRLEAEATLGGRVQRALAGGENLPLDHHGDDPADLREDRADHIATLARYAHHPDRHQPDPSRHPGGRDRGQRRPPER
jgi:hypothetical protein